jgi:hypothetical protein
MPAPAHRGGLCGCRLPIHFASRLVDVAPVFGTDYQDTAYMLLVCDEEPMMANAAEVVAGDFEALAMLTRVAAIMGLGTSFTGTTHSGSMAEHMISHTPRLLVGSSTIISSFSKCLTDYAYNISKLTEIQRALLSQALRRQIVDSNASLASKVLAQRDLGSSISASAFPTRPEIYPP